MIKTSGKSRTRFLIKLILGVVVLMAVALFALYTLNGRFVRNTLYNQIINAMELNQSLYAQDINAWFDTAAHTTRTLAVTLQALPDAKNFAEIAHRITLEYDFIESVFIGFADGTLINGSWWGHDDALPSDGLGWLPNEPGWSTVERPWFVNARSAGAGQLVTTEPYLSAETYYITASMSIWLPDLLDVGAAVGLSLALDFMLDALENHPVMGDGKLILLTDCGVVLFHPGDDLDSVEGQLSHITDMPGGQFILDSINAGERLITYDNLRIGAAYIVITRLGIMDWTLLSVVPIEVTHHPVYREFHTVMILMALFLLTLFVAVVAFIYILLHNMEKNTRHEEKMRLQYEHEQAAGRAKSSFLSHMSHEIRTPMNAIKSMTHFAKSAPDLHKKDAYILKIENASEHLLGLINQVLDMSQIEEDKFILSPGLFDLMQMISDISGIMSATAAAKDIYFMVDTDTKLPRMIEADERRLAQVVTNLLSNAIKFTPNGGMVWLHVKCLTPTQIQFIVTDTGNGIPDSELDTLFDAFVQAEEGRKIGGTGLGLAISKKIVDMMGGDISVETKRGKGATFLFNIPIAKELSKNDEDAPAIETIEPFAPDCFAGRTILLAEDIEINREIMLTLLEDSGAEVVCAENGEQTVRLFTEDPDRYSLILMDLQMPVMDGLAATRKIREVHTAIPIIALTANIFQEDIDACHAAGMNDHLGKPLIMGEVYKKIRHWMAHDWMNT
ncbi:MAG: ATP-binding protein [Defluviitaleaceae bacterium]|nr:ATP-binding protein [Defluviitaleaceae bacterium]